MSCRIIKGVSEVVTLKDGQLLRRDPGTILAASRVHYDAGLRGWSE